MEGIRKLNGGVKVKVGKFNAGREGKERESLKEEKGNERWLENE